MPSAEGLDGGVLVYPSGAPVEARFDRLLAPATVTRGSFGLRSGALGVFGGVRYDMVRRAVVFTPNPAELRPGLEYVMVGTAAIRGWDGAAQAAELRVRFRAGPRVPVASTAAPSLRREVAPLLASRCGASPCHGGAAPVMALDLSSPASIRNTTLGVRSRQWGDGPVTRADPAWGALDRIDLSVAEAQGRPEYSYLMYKLIGEGPMVGEVMPPGGAARLTEAELDLLARWIAAGAPDN